MSSKAAVAVLAIAGGLISPALAQDEDLAQGEKFYVLECKMCHGLVAPPRAAVGPSQQRVVRLAAQQSAGLTMRDFLSEVTSEPSASTTTTPPPGEDLDALRIAVSPPYGPNLRGVYGRPAGTVKGFTYSNAFVKALTGMEWTEAALDVWITNPQKWVPGVYMYYKQTDAEVRRKIILYLKANP